MSEELLEPNGLLRGDCFHLEVDGVSTAGFSRCVGLEAEVEVFEYREGGCEGVRTLRGRALPGRLVLERGLVRDTSLWHWFRSGEARSGAVLLLDGGGRERARWTFRGAWPTRWTGPELDPARSQVAVERLEIVHEGIEWQAR